MSFCTDETSWGEDGGTASGPDEADKDADDWSGWWKEEACLYGGGDGETQETCWCLCSSLTFCWCHESQY